MNDKVINSRRYYAIVVFTIIAVILFVVGRQRKRFFTDSGVVWTTEYHITYEAQRDLNDSIQFILNKIDNSVSPFNKTSLVSKINNNSTTAVDAYFTLLYKTSVKVNRESNGAYDPTVMPLVNAWGFGYKTGALPDKAQIDSMLHFVGMPLTSLANGRITKRDSRTQFDFSSIAKGMACDEIGRMLLRNGAGNFIVEIGGEVALRGVNDRGAKWHVSVDMPIDNDSTIEHKSALTLALDSGGVATSGNYRNYKMVNGKKVAHILNPLTGYPEVTNLLSATIIADNCMTADAWATACIAMGLDRTKKMMENNTKLGVMLISADSKGNMVVWSNKKFADAVVTQ